MRALLAYLRIRRVGHEHAERLKGAKSGRRRSTSVCRAEESGPEEKIVEWRIENGYTRKKGSAVTVIYLQI